jgi:hypothetical protein
VYVLKELKLGKKCRKTHKRKSALATVLEKIQRADPMKGYVEMEVSQKFFCIYFQV